MRARVKPDHRLGGEFRVPGDKSIAHRWLILAVLARGASRLTGLPSSLDVRSTASCLAQVSLEARPALDVWSSKAASWVERAGSTWNDILEVQAGAVLELEGEGRSALTPPARELDCGNSGTSMRLLAGVLASVPIHSVLIGDRSLSARPMERVAQPLRRMGASVATEEGHPPVAIDGGRLVGIVHEPDVASAQVKGAVLLAGLAADGATTVEEPAATRDHTERALVALGAPLEARGRRITVARFQHDGFAGIVPGDVSSAAFLIAAAALTGSQIVASEIGLNPSRLGFLEVMARMGVRTRISVEREEVGEPVGRIEVEPCAGIFPTRIDGTELPLVIDEVPVLAMLAAQANGETRFLGAGELRVKESDRLTSLLAGIEALGGVARGEGDDLVIGGGGLAGGVARAGGDHRIAMALAVGALGARGPSEIEGIEAADVSFPGFVGALASLGAGVEVVG
jgi:3-phosphoshikimate 1-carboxyvinyltransferase